MGKSRKRQDGGRPGMTDREIRRYALLLVIPAIVILVALAVLLSGALGSRSGGTGSSGTRGPVETLAPEQMPVIEPDTKQYFQDFGGSILTKDGDPAVTQLMEQYFLAITDCDMETFLHLFTSQDTSEEEMYRQEFEKQAQYMEGYQNISCYTAPGLREGELAVYVYYEVRYRGVETAAPGLVQVYAVLCEDGQYRIDDGQPDGERTEYLEQLSGNEDVRLLISQVDRQMEEALEADTALRERVEYMKSGPDYMREESE